MFKLWSENNQKAKEFLKPDLGLRNWNDLQMEEKNKIWLYMVWFFFDKDTKTEYSDMGMDGNHYYEFYGEYKEKEYKQQTIILSILLINENYKVKSFAEMYLKNRNLNTACYDFYNIYMKQDESVVMELLSVYAKHLYETTKNAEYVYKGEKENDEQYLERKTRIEFKFFDTFSERLNDVFRQFGIQYYLSREGFIPRQESKIMEEIYQPVLKFLKNEKWKEVNSLLADSFEEYRKNTPLGFSNCITNTVSAIQAFLQVLSNGKTGKGSISQLITTAQKKSLIPGDFFTKNIFNNMESIFAKERQETGIAHPKKDYATEKNARTILNLAMVFLQHCIQK